MTLLYYIILYIILYYNSGKKYPDSMDILDPDSKSKSKKQRLFTLLMVIISKKFFCERSIPSLSVYRWPSPHWQISLRSLIITKDENCYAIFELLRFLNVPTR